MLFGNSLESRIFYITQPLITQFSAATRGTSSSWYRDVGLCASIAMSEQARNKLSMFSGMVGIGTPKTTYRSYEGPM